MATTQPWDVIVVGAGPAGSAAAAAALCARADARVLLLDRQRFPRDKPCGDGIAAEALDELGVLGFDVDAIVDGYPPIDRLRLTAPRGGVVERRMARPVRTIPRQVFDHRLLVDVLRRGAVLRRHQVRAIRRDAGEVVVDGDLRARVLIGADGAESVVRRRCASDAGPGGRASRHVALAIRGYSRPLNGQGRTQWIIMSGRNWPAYAWSFPTGQGVTNVGYGELLGRRPIDRAGMLHRMTQLLPGLDPPTLVRAHRLPLSPGRPQIADGPILLAGDALSLINPLSGEGIFYAVRSGGLAGRAAVAGGDPGAMYRRELGRALDAHLRSTGTAARLVRAPRLIDSAVAAAAGNQRVFDDLVSLALADGRLTARLVGGLVSGTVRSASPRRRPL
jgi:geranylgeranyl reductase family protein